MTFDPKSVEVTRVTLPKDHCVQVPWKYIKVCGYSDPFFKNLNKRSLISRWTLIPHDPHLLRSYVWLYPRIIVSKSHGNTSMYVDTVIDFAKYHIHTTYIHTTYTMSDHIVSFWTKFRHDNKTSLSPTYPLSFIKWMRELKCTIQQYVWCDQEKWVNSFKYWFWDTAKQNDKFPLLSICLQNLQLLVSLELTNQFSWGFC